MEIFERCCGFIYESLDTPVALLIGTAVVATLIYFYNRKFHAKKWNDGVCQAPSCLRCNSGDSFRERTVGKFQNYLEECRNPEMLSDLKEAIMAKRESPETFKSLQRPTLLWLKRIEPRRWYDATHVHEKDVEILENNLSIILDEFRSLEGKPGWIVNQANPGCWRIYHLMSQGIFTVNATACPRTVDVLRRLSGLMVGTVFGYASFSVLEPGTAVAPHFGASNCRIRCHLVFVQLRNEDGMFRCEVCNKQFIFECDLNSHMSTHNGEKHFVCNICQLKFSCRSSLLYHSKIHSGERPYTCEECQRSFRQRGHLINHLRIHSGEMPFSCLVCSRRFNQKSNLTTHYLKMHAGEKAPQ
ncbi:zinc finger protein 561-like isoform X1 [Centruroides sculpturatus]|uniref:zinc finger protein 561-like isoform X1 n=1 Tax=Centruroides sculpturatus TaxID=218467 RepID=UPI000C6D5B1B|nr:zinc finger protein 561-like isoform X1 [Centruroides sculpturatus]